MDVPYFLTSLPGLVAAVIFFFFFLYLNSETWPPSKRPHAHVHVTVYFLRINS